MWATGKSLRTHWEALPGHLLTCVSLFARPLLYRLLSSSEFFATRVLRPVTTGPSLTSSTTCTSVGLHAGKSQHSTAQHAHSIAYNNQICRGLAKLWQAAMHDLRPGLPPKNFQLSDTAEQGNFWLHCPPVPGTKAFAGALCDCRCVVWSPNC